MHEKHPPAAGRAAPPARHVITVALHKFLLNYAACFSIAPAAPLGQCATRPWSTKGSSNGQKTRTWRWQGERHQKSSAIRRHQKSWQVDQ